MAAVAGGETKVANRSPISKIFLVNRGMNYTTATIKIDGNATASVNLSNGSIASIDLVFAGTYSKVPRVEIVGDGSGAYATAVLQNIFDTEIKIQVEKGTINSGAQTILCNAQISTTFNGERQGLNVFVGLDISHSMSGKKLRLAKSGVSKFLGTLGSQDVICLGTFHSVANEVFPCAYCTPANFKKALEVLDKVDVRGCTNVIGGLEQMFSSKTSCSLGSTNKNVGLFITDGDPYGEQVTSDGVLKVSSQSYTSFEKNRMISEVSDFVNHQRCNGGVPIEHQMSMFCIDVGGSTDLTQQISDKTNGKSIGGAAEGLMHQIELMGRTIKSSASSLEHVRYDLRSVGGSAVFLDGSTVDFSDFLSDGSVVNKPFKMNVQAGAINPEIEFRLKAEMISNGKFSDITRSNKRTILRSMIGGDTLAPECAFVRVKHAEERLASQLQQSQKEADDGDLNSAVERLNLARAETEAVYRGAAVPFSSRAAWVQQVSSDIDAAMKSDNGSVLRAIRGVSGIAGSNLLRAASAPAKYHPTGGGVKISVETMDESDDEDFCFGLSPLVLRNT